MLSFSATYYVNYFRCIPYINCFSWIQALDIPGTGKSQFKPRLKDFSNPNCDEMDIEILLIDGILRSAIFTLCSILMVLSAPSNSLANGTSSSSMFHQKYFLIWEKQKIRF